MQGCKGTQRDGKLEQSIKSSSFQWTTFLSDCLLKLIVHFGGTCMIRTPDVKLLVHARQT